MPRAHAEPVDAARLRARLSPEVADHVLTVVRTAEEQGLPTRGIVARALEGQSRHAPAAAIVDAVSRQANALATARRALGGTARDAELEAGASALLGGVPEDSLTVLRRARPTGSLVIPLVVLSDLVARGVPAPQASNTVAAAARAGAADPELLRMRERVNQRILKGEPPPGATREGLRELLMRTAPDDRRPPPGATTKKGEKSP
jgi:hypothetical protein